ncbi:hypothetical protein QJS66_10285 [Kocuria rhizophila]|nr:hypothetical protein QJS66_10285 [Kocuria rhizophila]
MTAGLPRVPGGVGPVAPVTTFTDGTTRCAWPARPVRPRLLRVHRGRSPARCASGGASGLRPAGPDVGVISNAAAPFGGVRSPAWAARAAPRASPCTTVQSWAYPPLGLIRT